MGKIYKIVSMIFLASLLCRAMPVHGADVISPFDLARIRPRSKIDLEEPWQLTRTKRPTREKKSAHVAQKSRAQNTKLLIRKTRKLVRKKIANNYIVQRPAASRIVRSDRAMPTHRAQRHIVRRIVRSGKAKDVPTHRAQRPAARRIVRSDRAKGVPTHRAQRPTARRRLIVKKVRPEKEMPEVFEDEEAVRVENEEENSLPPSRLLPKPLPTPPQPKPQSEPPKPKPSPTPPQPEPQPEPQSEPLQPEPQSEPQPTPQPEPQPEPSPQDSVVRNGLVNFKASCYINSTLQMLNLIPWFREKIMNSNNNNSCILALQALFRCLNSPKGIEKDHLKRLLEEEILPAMNKYITTQEKPFTLLIPNDVLNFRLAFTNMLKDIGEVVDQDFDVTTISDSAAEEQKNSIYLFRESEPGMQEIPGEFEQALFDQFMGPEKKIKTLPRNLAIEGRDKFRSDRVRPMSIPFELIFPKETMIESEPVKYILSGAFIYRGDGHFGHYTYLHRNQYGNFWIYNDSSVQQINDKRAQDILKTQARLLVYEREN
ncbi:MAG: ubiquitin carboxyl-terminal hydrolase [Puniceicoccales bacterium]|nr:ubiquitin carboxyl-terminal hydrolase [Puniceicoccales bacterium]